MLVNGQDISQFDVANRSALLLSGSTNIDRKSVNKAINQQVQDGVRSYWAKFIKSPEVNAKFREYVQSKGARTQADVERLKGEFARDMQQAHAQRIAKGIQQRVVNNARSRARKAALPKVRDQALRELVNEQLQIFAAKQAGITISDSDVTKQFETIATRNNQTVAQFEAQLRSMGSHASSLRSKIKAQIAWGQVVRR